MPAPKRKKVNECDLERAEVAQECTVGGIEVNVKGRVQRPKHKSQRAEARVKA